MAAALIIWKMMKKDIILIKGYKLALSTFKLDVISRCKGIPHDRGIFKIASKHYL
jgi:hypothetical protein